MASRKTEKKKHDGGRYRLDGMLGAQLESAAAARGMSVVAYIRAAVAASMGVCPTCGTSRDNKETK